MCKANGVFVVKEMNDASPILYELFIGTLSHVNTKENKRMESNSGIE